MSGITEPAPGTVAAATHLATLDCIHCGLCIEQCPTYLVTGRESMNPRGRVYLMRALLEGRQEPTPDLVLDLDLCLVCRACESACPSGVRFGEVLTTVRSGLRRRGLLRRWLMDGVLPDPRRLRRLAGLVRFWQRSGLRVLQHILPRRLRRMEAALPRLPDSGDALALPPHTPALGAPRGSVALLEGCMVPVLMPQLNRDTVRLLTVAGFDVVVPEGQGCCGALHEHDGALDVARGLARVNVGAFAETATDALVTNSAGCGAGLRGYPHLIGPEGQPVADRAVDVLRFLADRGERLSFGSTSERVTWDAPCHLQHAQQETTALSALLAGIMDLDLVPLPEADLCCGAAGVYNLDHPDVADRILERKLDALAGTGATVLLSSNPGCLLQWQQGVRRRGLEVRVVHPVTFLCELLEDQPEEQAAEPRQA